MGTIGWTPGDLSQTWSILRHCFFYAVLALFADCFGWVPSVMLNSFDALSLLSVAVVILLCFYQTGYQGSPLVSGSNARGPSDVAFDPTPVSLELYTLI